MSYESIERAIDIDEYERALYDNYEVRYDPDQAWIDQWEEENKKYLLDKWIQETEERWV